MKTFSSAKYLTLVFIILTLQLWGCRSCLDNERMGLLEIKAYLNTFLTAENSRENILQSWTDDLNSNCCHWERVNCSMATEHVIQLSLNEVLPDSYPLWPNRTLNLSLLHCFMELQSLDFSGNQFSGMFDHIEGFNSFGRLKKLRILNLAANDFDNSIFLFLSTATSLRTLDLWSNRLKGVFPPKELASMTNLKVLNVSSNQFSFLAFHDLANLRELEVLELNGNQINNSDAGQGESSLISLHMNVRNFVAISSPMNLTNLQKLDLSWNRFSGFSIFQGLSYPTKLQILNLRYNALSNFSKMQDLAYLRELRELGLSGNNLDDTSLLRQALGNLTNLQKLDLSWNGFSGFSIFQALGNLTNLQQLDLSNNRFSGFSVFQELRVKQNCLGGALGNLTNLQKLDLSGNRFSGFSVFQDLVNLKNLKVLNLRANQINGSLTTEVFTNLTKLEALDLSDNLLYAKPQMQGYSGICGLTYLRELDLSGNAFTTLPYCLGNLRGLRTLDLSHNQLNGNLTSFLSGFPSLEYLSLFGNNFEGSFLFSSLTNQSRLKVFKLSSILGTIQVQTEIPWIPLFQLKMLQLHNCTLGGRIPGFLLHQHDLHVIDLSHNKLVGAFPSWLLQNNTKLQSIILTNNSLTEFRLPTLVHGLRDLDISNNKIVGFLHGSIGTFFPNLTTMNISNNGFQGVIPSSMGEMKRLWVLDMSNNSLSGQLPINFISGCYSLTFLILSNNKFEGQIFLKYSNLAALFLLLLDGNNFTSIGKGLLKSTILRYLDISNNMLSGEIPSWIGRLSILTCLWMRGNQIEGPFPHQLQDLTHLNLLDISDNRLSSSLPLKVSFSSLKVLRLQNNDLIGPIPDALFNSTDLQVLDLRNNKLSGKIPESIGMISQLNVLLLQKNYLHGHIPKEICQLREVNLLDLSHNRFDGVIPSCLNDMSFGALAYHRSTTNIFGNGSMSYSMTLTSEMFYFYTSDLDLSKDYISYDFQPPPMVVEFLTKSRYESYEGDILPYMFGIDLSSNKLSGDIPSQVGDLQNIRSLNLSHNRLTGSIPESFSKLKNIESLDLSYNRLNANIPTQLAELDNLGYFNVSYNDLSGPIPFTGHLTTFDGRSYIGNANLCGSPTNKSCGFTKMPESAKSQHVRGEDEDLMIDMPWFYWSFGTAYVFILLGLFVFLSLDSRWTREWFYRVDLCVYHLQSFKRAFVSK